LRRIVWDMMRLSWLSLKLEGCGRITKGLIDDRKTVLETVFSLMGVLVNHT
jgi:hypothetical protein